MNISKFVISLDFELFWGVSDRQSIAGYGRNVMGEWEAIPRMLDAFRRHRLRVTWATVGMIMCRDYRQWREIRPTVLPGYARPSMSPYGMHAMVRDNPRLFFARPLVERILATPGQELASHTYSHFYCDEPGATPDQLAADLACARSVVADLGAQFRSAVFPRNQIVERFLVVLPAAGIDVYRGNSRHWLYRNGDAVAGGMAGRAVRFADACLPLSGSASVREQADGALVNLPASLFLYPWRRPGAMLALRQHRIKRAMTAAARSGSVFHLWWHPHNFGLELERNMALLEDVLAHYHRLAACYGMQSQCMGDFGEVRTCPLPEECPPAPPKAASPGRRAMMWSPP